MQAVQASNGTPESIVPTSDKDVLSQAIESGQYLVMKRKMLQKTPLSMDDFSAICFKCPDMANLAIEQYPELAKDAPFELLLALCRRSTYQEVIYEAVNVHNGGGPTTEDVLIALINAGANITGREKITGYTLLHHAIENDLPRAAMALLDHGIDPLAKIHWGVTPLHMASQKGLIFYDVVRRITQVSEAACQVTKLGSTPLHYAARAKCIFAAEALIEAGADQLALDDMEQTALDIAELVPDNFHVVSRLKQSDASHALSRHNIDKAIELLKQGEILPEDDFLSLCICRQNHAMRIVQECPQSVKYFSDQFFVSYLRKCGGSFYQKLTSALFDTGISPSGVEEKSKCTTLHLALEKRDGSLAKKLIAAGLNPSARDEFGSTPLHYSASNNMGEVLMDLVQKGAHPLVRNHSKKTPTPYQAALKHKSTRWLKAYVNLFPAPFRDFAAKKFENVYEVTSELYSDTLAEFAKTPGALLSCCTPESTPLEIFFLLIRKIEHKYLTAEQKSHGIQLLRKKYPGKLTDEYIKVLFP